MSRADKAAGPRRAALTKGRAVSLVVLLALVLLLVGTQTWVDVTLPEAGVQQEGLSVPGTAASPAWTALTIAAAAAGVAAAVAKKWMRMASLVLAALFFAVLAGMAFYVAGNPVPASATKVAEKIGLQGMHTGVTAHLTAWTWAAFLIALAAALLTVLTAWLSLRWGTTAKYARIRSEENGRALSTQAQAIDAWDDLTAGEDPTRA